MRHRSPPSFVVPVFLVMVSLFLLPEAYANLNQVNTVMGTIETALKAISVSVFTVCIMWAGYKMAFQGARWSDIAHIVIGGLIFAAAGGIATMLVGTAAK